MTLPLVDFTQGPVERGAFIRLHDGLVWEFLLNPDTIKDEKGGNYSVDNIPGSSSPSVRWHSSAQTKITFTLVLDAEIQRRLLQSGKRRSQGGISETGDTDESSVESNFTFSDELSIHSELNFLKSLEYPEDRVKTNPLHTEIRPVEIRFKMGRRYPGLRYVLTKAAITITKWTAKLEPWRATVDITLFSIAPKSAVASQIWPGDLHGCKYQQNKLQLSCPCSQWCRRTA